MPCEREGRLPAVTASAHADDGGLATAARDSEVMDRLRRLEDLVVRMSEHLPNEHMASSSPGPHASGPALLQQLTPVSTAEHVPTPIEISHQADARKLENVCTTGNALAIEFSDQIVFKTLPLTDMAHCVQAQPQAGTRLINLPLKDEALCVFEAYVQYVSYLHHIMHIPSARSMVHEIYADLARGNVVGAAAYGKVALLLAIIASAASFQVAVEQDELLPTTVDEAKRISIQMVKAALDVLEYIRRSAMGSVEYVQAMISIFFLMYNLGGFSTLCRAGLGDALVVARDIRLHRTDFIYDRGQCPKALSEVEKETRRRVWWHLTASDWVISLSGGPSEGIYNIHPAHIACHKPRNINDDEILNLPPDFSHPLSVPTDASYLIQRIRLAAICRHVVDAMPLSPATPDAIPYSQLLELDQMFQSMIDELPFFFKNDAASRQKARAIHRSNSHIAIQRYMITMTLNTRRCKLHQPFLIRGFTNPMYRHSRDICLESARIVLQIKKELAGERLFGAGLLNLSGINHHIFFAAIALVMDLCYNQNPTDPASPAESAEERRKEVWEALSMLKAAKDSNLSAVAGRFLGSLTEVLKKHRVRLDDFEEPNQKRSTNGLPHPIVSNSDQIMQMTGVLDGWQEQPLPDFDELWQGCIEQGQNFEVTDWEQLFSDLEPQF